MFSAKGKSRKRSIKEISLKKVCEQSANFEVKWIDVKIDFGNLSNNPITKEFLASSYWASSTIFK